MPVSKPPLYSKKTQFLTSTRESYWKEALASVITLGLAPAISNMLSTWLPGKYTWVFVLIAFVLFALVPWLVRHKLASSSLSKSPTPQDREHMLRRLRLLYERMFKDSLLAAVQEKLGLVSSSVLLEHSANLSLHRSDQPEHPLPAPASIQDAYNQAGGELLVLGDPGVGKSTLLLELTRHLLTRAQADAAQPLPILLSLSSWDGSPLEEWIGTQIVTSGYDMPAYVAEQWIQQNTLLPLLDGLNEIDEKVRAACIAEINTYRRNHLLGLVVSCRTDDYAHLVGTSSLDLPFVVTLQPRSQKQVADQIEELITQGKPLKGLRAMLRQNPMLQGLAARSLTFGLLLLTYHGLSNRKLSSKLPLLQQQLWENYLNEQMKERKDTNNYRLESVLAWLGWLAQQMQCHRQTIFSLEEIEPDWLPKTQSQFYRISFIVLGGLYILFMSGFLVGDVGCALFGFLSSSFFSSLTSLIVGSIVGSLLGLVWQMCFSFCTWQGTQLLLRSPSKWKELQLSRISPKEVFMISIGFGMVLQIISPRFLGDVSQNRFFVFPIASLSIFCIGLFVRRVENHLISSSSRPEIKGIWLAVISCASTSVVGGFILASLYLMPHLETNKKFTSRLPEPSPAWLASIQSQPIGTQLVMALKWQTALVQHNGPASLLLELIYQILPPHSPWYDVLLFFLFMAIIFLLTLSLAVDDTPILVLFAPLRWPLIPLRQWLLLFWLSQSSCFPRRAQQFLDDAVTRTLLKRVGRGYSFTHQLLQEYCALLGPQAARSQLSGPPPVGATLHIYKGHIQGIDAIAWSPDSVYIASAGEDSTVQVWTAANGNVILIYKGHSKAVHRVVWSPDGKYIASAGEDHTVQIWNTTTGNVVFTYKEYKEEVPLITWSPDGKYIASAGEDGSIQVWTAITGDPAFSCKAHSKQVQTLLWSPDGTRIASVEKLDTIRVWDASNGNLVCSCKKVRGLIDAIAWSPDSARIASTEGFSLQVWDVINGIPLWTYTPGILLSSSTSAPSWSLDGKRIASVEAAGTIRMLDASNGKPVFTYKGHRKISHTLAWSPDGKFIASGNYYNDIQIWQGS